MYYSQTPGGDQDVFSVKEQSWRPSFLQLMFFTGFQDTFSYIWCVGGVTNLLFLLCNNRWWQCTFKLVATGNSTEKPIKAGIGNISD